MKQKIEWYKEVLEIEPNSKIFFPLSRMLVKDDRPDEAIAVLRQGVGRHPDHVEARLFLAELLYSSGNTVALQQEVEVLSGLFRSYPGFWRAWGERLFAGEGTKDAGLAAIFLAAFLQNVPVSWAGVIEHGLKSLVSNNTARLSANVPETHPLAAPASSSPSPGRPRQEEVPFDRSSPAAFSDAESEAAGSRGDASRIAQFHDLEEIAENDAAEDYPESEASVRAEVQADVAAAFMDDDADDELDDPITLRTRSMADVLAEQGDIPGALEIYTELLSAASSDAEKADLRTRMDALSSSAARAEGRGTAGTVPNGGEPKKDWLAVLAQRLEARSLQ